MNQAIPPEYDKLVKRGRILRYVIAIAIAAGAGKTASGETAEWHQNFAASTYLTSASPLSPDLELGSCASPAGRGG